MPLHPSASIRVPASAASYRFSDKSIYMPDRLFLSPPHMGPDEQRNVAEVFASNWIAPIGPMLDRFEHELAALTGSAEVVGLSSGTAALHLALRLSDIGPQDEVWGSTLTFIGGVAPILYQNATPVFLDVDPDTLLLDLALLEQALETRRAEGRRMPRAVISTDLYGSAIDTGRMQALAARFGFCWISDTAEAVGSRCGADHAGHGADFVVLSFNGNKIITTSGGGALGCKDPVMAQRARFLATQARDPAAHYEHTTFGYNYRLSNVCAAIGVGQLGVLNERVAARRAIHAHYYRLLANHPGIRFHPEPEGGKSNRWLTTIEIDPERAGASPEDVRLALEAENIESRPLWKPMHMQPLFQEVPAIGGDKAAQAFERGLCLPSGSAMSEDEVERVAGIMLRTVR